MIPHFKKTGRSWEGIIQLNEWDKVFECQLNLALNIGGDSITYDITEIHENTLKYIVEQQECILNVVFDALYLNYPIWQEEYGYEGDEKTLFMPDISCKEDLKLLLVPQKIYIMNIEADNLAYYGIELNCRWDEEHGIGLMLYKCRVVEVGGSETAFMTWIAEGDNERIRKSGQS